MNSAASGVAVITGGSSGIGRATALRFVQAGYRVAICGRQPGKLAQSFAAIREASPDAHCLSITTDVAHPESAKIFLAQVQEHFGRMDVLVNCAGHARLASVTEFAPEEFDALIRNNLSATFYCCQAVIPYLRARGRGVIVNFSSLAAVDPLRGFAVYGACKAWIELFTRALADELAADQIAVFSVRPGAVETPMLREVLPSFPGDAALSPSDVAEVIWRLTDPVWMHSTGMAIPVRLP
jgi:3-oxoacyl-[acyl-carrier protein] reductase